MTFDTPALIGKALSSHDVQLYEEKEIHFHCPCSRERLANVLKTLNAKEVRELLHENGKIEARCEYCGEEYVFTAREVEGLLQVMGKGKLH